MKAVEYGCTSVDSDAKESSTGSRSRLFIRDTGPLLRITAERMELNRWRELFADWYEWAY
jgi:hypothetical protein